MPDELVGAARRVIAGEAGARAAVAKGWTLLWLDFQRQAVAPAMAAAVVDALEHMRGRDFAFAGRAYDAATAAMWVLRLIDSNEEFRFRLHRAAVLGAVDRLMQVADAVTEKNVRPSHR